MTTTNINNNLLNYPTNTIFNNNLAYQYLYQTSISSRLYNTYTTQQLFNNNMTLYATQAWVTSQNYLSSAVMSNYLLLTGGIITDSTYNNTPLKIHVNPNSTENSYSQDYIAITTANDQYGGSFAGGIQQNVGGYLTLNTINNATGTTYMMCIAGCMYTYAHLYLNGAYNIIVNNVTMTPTIFNSLVQNYNLYATMSWVQSNCLTIQNNKMSLMYNTGRDVEIGFESCSANTSYIDFHCYDSLSAD
jgi:hypothetical protein